MKDHDFADDFWESKEEDFIDVEDVVEAPNVSEKFLEATQDINALLGKVTSVSEEKKEEIDPEENKVDEEINDTTSNSEDNNNYNQVSNSMNDLTELTNSVEKSHIESSNDDAFSINNTSSLSDLNMTADDKIEEIEDNISVLKSQEISPKLKKMFKEDDALAKKEVEEIDVRNDLKIGIIMLGIFLLFIIILPLIFDVFK